MTEGSDLPTHERKVPYTDPGTPDVRSPARYLWWLVVMQRGRILLGSLWGTLWMCALMLPPYFMAKAIDDGLKQRDTDTLLFWVLIIMVAGAAIACLGILRHRTMTLIRTDAAYRTVQVVVRQVTDLGATLPRKVSVGELTHLQAGDMGRIAQTLTITGPGVGAVIAYSATAVLLFTISAVLAGVVLLGLPLLALAVGPLLGKLHGAESTYREQQGELTARAGDIVSGLGVLCGIGGKAIFGKRYRDRSQALLADGYRVASFTSWVQAIGACLPVIFLAIVTWISARMAASGTISVGEMVAVYGYVAALLVPVTFFIEGADDLPRGLVAARRVINILALKPEVENGSSPVAAPAGPAALHDPRSGLTLEPGLMSALVCARLDEARAVVDRLGRYTDSDATWGDARLSDVELSEVRRRVLVADNDAHLFAGTVRSTVSVRDDHTADELDGALRTAVAEDIVDALPDGLDARLEARARNVSGGQRQRLRLVRALLTDPEVLLLVEPTSALDAHTEATVAQRVLTTRRGRTTLAVSTSPLILDRADQVSYLVGGEVVAVGTHGELLVSQPGYRDLVLRDSDETDPTAQGTALQEGSSR
ncbi:ABC transporter transmembrane domain-containing protein [Streptomyces sp. NPDC088246]|uniref:ABC transporter transmembrane domain-containing protein n=1 Tax=Streptomyces sp. NPDC088246 TaxID=3365842 RepID=UPI00381DB12F